MQSLSLHNNGNKHKEMVEVFNRKKKDEKLFGNRSERDLQKQLAEIERAAAEAIQADRAEHGDIFQAGNVRRAPPPPPRPGNGTWTKKDADSEREETVEGSLKENKYGRLTIIVHTHLTSVIFCRYFDVSFLFWCYFVSRTGLYTIKGQSYLEGQVNEELLRGGLDCQIFIEACYSICWCFLALRHITTPLHMIRTHT